MEKYGFIYLWYDMKRKMFYIGSHWGTEDDGYICSSNRMRDAYRRRPNDFKRKIIQKNISRDVLLNEEHKWLQMISDDELGKKYYNLRKHKWGHWSTDISSNLSVQEKIKATLSKPEVKEKIGAANRGRLKSEEEILKIKKARIKQVFTTETREKMSQSSKGILNPFYGKKHTDETRKRMSQSAFNRKKKK
jgi:NUMOD3 motif